MYSAVGRSTTIASTSPEVRACLTWSLSLNGDTGVVGSMVSWAAVRLVVPTIAPIFRRLQVRERRRVRAGRPLERHDGLRGRVVRRREVEVGLALVADRHLVDREVEVLGARRDDLVEAGDGPLDVVLVEAQLVGHRVRDGGLEALAVGRVAVDDPRLVRGVGRGDRQDAVLDRGQRAVRRGVGRAARRPSGRRRRAPGRRWRRGWSSGLCARRAPGCRGDVWHRIRGNLVRDRERSTGAPSQEREQPWVTGTTTV